MLHECIDILDGEYGEKLEQMIIDNYIPKDGIYYIYKKIGNGFEQTTEPITIKYDKKQNILLGREHSQFHNVCQWDYYSKIIDTNKCIVNKKIHSNNYLSFFVKQENVLNNEITDDMIEKYFDILANPYLKYTKAKQKEIYDATSANIRKLDPCEIQQIADFIKEELPRIKESLKNPKEYLKIFIEAPIEDYQAEGKRYLIPNIYNSADYNVNINGKIYGLPNDNMGLNSKKPYLENKTRKVRVPYLIDSEHVYRQKLLFDYLATLATKGTYNVFFSIDPMAYQRITAIRDDGMLEEPFCGIYLRLQVGKALEIIHTDHITQYEPKLKRPFELHNVLDVDYLEDENSSKFYGEITSVKEMKDLLNTVLYNKFLSSHFFTKPEDIPVKGTVLKQNIVYSRDRVFAWLYKSDETSVDTVMERVTKRMIESNISDGYLKKASHQFNLRCSLQEYFHKGERSMADVMIQIRETLKDKIISEVDEAIQSDEEYYFAVGQLVNYFISLSKTKKKMHSLANPFFNAKKDSILKTKLEHCFKQYNYAIATNRVRFNKLYSMVASYQPDGVVLSDYMIAGYLTKCFIFYKSNEK